MMPPHVMSTEHIGIILFAHGSRDPLWAKPIEALAQRIRELSPQTPVACAYLELMAPDLPAAVRDMLSQNHGIRRVKILPVFFGMGRHARQDLPQLRLQLQTEHSQVHFDTLPAAGEQATVLDAIAQSALRAF
jgi:sirohydrochlorin cobaltochelatase